MPAELATYLSYVERHKESLIKTLGGNRWISHSGHAKGSTFYLDELLRIVSWEMPADMQRNVTATGDKSRISNGQVSLTLKRICL